MTGLLYQCSVNNSVLDADRNASQQTLTRCYVHNSSDDQAALIYRVSQKKNNVYTATNRTMTGNNYLAVRIYL